MLERAAGFSPDDADRARRLMRAAEAALTAGDGRKAGELAAAAGRHTRDRAVLGRATVVAATVASWSGRIREAYRLWMEAADHYAAARPEATGAPLFRAVEHAWKSGDVAGAEAAAERAERLGLEHAPGSATWPWPPPDSTAPAPRPPPTRSRHCAACSTSTIATAPRSR
ncbi:hypothetical protein GCM10029992_10750 [Glycomyces albus]